MGINLQKICLKSTVVPAAQVVARKIEDELIIVPIESGGLTDSDGAMFSLNDTGKDVWNRLSPEKTVEMICQELADEYEVSLQEIQADVIELLNLLYEKHIVEEAASV